MTPDVVQRIVELHAAGFSVFGIAKQVRTRVRVVDVLKQSCQVHPHGRAVKVCPYCTRPLGADGSRAPDSDCTHLEVGS